MLTKFHKIDFLYVIECISKVLDYAYEEGLFLVINEDNILLDFDKKQVLYCPMTFNVNTENIAPNIYSIGDDVVEDEESHQKFSDDKYMSEFLFWKQLIQFILFYNQASC